MCVLKLQKVQKQEQIQQHYGRILGVCSCIVLRHTIRQYVRSESQVQNMKGFRVEELINVSTNWEACGRNAVDLHPRYLSGITSLTKVWNENLRVG